MNYEVWWAFKNEENRKQFTDTMNSYENYFQTAIHAHFVAMIVAIYKLFEKRKDSINVYQLFDTIQNIKNLPVSVCNDIQADIDKMKPLWTKVSILRNEQFGHKSNKSDYKVIFSKANVKPRYLRELILGSKQILDKLSYNYDRSSLAWNLSAESDTRNLLADLKLIREQRNSNRDK